MIDLIYNIGGRYFVREDGQLIQVEYGINKPCPCGSGKKLKKCCRKIEVRSVKGII